MLEGIEASVAGSKFNASLVRFQGCLMLDELALDPRRLLLLDGVFEIDSSGGMLVTLIDGRDGFGLYQRLWR